MANSTKRFSIKDSRRSSIYLPCARFRCRECNKLVYGEVMNFTNDQSKQIWIGGDHKGNPAGPLCVTCKSAKKFSRIEMTFND